MLTAETDTAKRLICEGIGETLLEHPGVTAIWMLAQHDKVHFICEMTGQTPELALEGWLYPRTNRYPGGSLEQEDPTDTSIRWLSFEPRSTQRDTILHFLSGIEVSAEDGTPVDATAIHADPGINFLVVGQDWRSNLGVLQTALHYKPDGSVSDAYSDDYWAQVAQQARSYDAKTGRYAMQ